MKKTIAALAFSLLAWAGASAGNIKETSVPAVVRDYVAKNYPRVAPVEWDYNDRGNYYTAEFRIEGAEYELDITPDGKLLNSDIEIATSQLPAPVALYIGKHYPTFKVEDAKKLTRRGMTSYEVEIQGPNSDLTLFLSGDGTLLRTED